MNNQFHNIIITSYVCLTKALKFRHTKPKLWKKNLFLNKKYFYVLVLYTFVALVKFNFIEKDLSSFFFIFLFLLWLRHSTRRRSSAENGWTTTKSFIEFVFFRLRNEYILCVHTIQQADIIFTYIFIPIRIDILNYACASVRAVNSLYQQKISSEFCTNIFTRKFIFMEPISL